MGRFDSWVTETGPDRYCSGAEDCRGRHAPVLGAGIMTAAKQWLDGVLQLLSLALIADHSVEMNEVDAATKRCPTGRFNRVFSIFLLHSFFGHYIE